MLHNIIGITYAKTSMTDSAGDPTDKSIDASDETSGALSGSQPSSDVEPDAIATSPQPQPAPEPQTSPEPPKSEIKAKPVTNSVKPVWWRLINATTNMALAFANIIMFFSFAGYLSKYWFLCELSSHFRLLYAPFFLVFLIPCLILRRWRLVSIVGTFALINILTIVPRTRALGQTCEYA